MAYTSADVPDLFDIFVNGFGYRFDRSYDDSPYRKPSASYGHTPTFLERTNISGAYGDNNQDFYLTVSQDDWSGGEGQRFLRTNDPQSRNKYFGTSTSGGGIQITTPGQVTLAPEIFQDTISNGTLAACGAGATIGISTHAYAQTDSHLWTITGTTETDQGVHGAGTVSEWGMCTDGTYVYISGGTKLRKWTGSAFSDFSATVCGPIAYLNNALYGYVSGQLVVYSTAGTQSVLYTWKDAAGGSLAPAGVKLIPFGGTLLILFPTLSDRPELWQYDGTNTFKIVGLPQSVVAYDCNEIEGIVYISGLLTDTPSGTTAGATPIIYVYVNGTLTEVWRSLGTVSAATGISARTAPRPALGNLSGRLIFIDPLSLPTSAYVRQLDFATGAVTSLGFVSHSESSGNFTPYISSTATSVLVVWKKAGTAGGIGVYPNGTTFASTSSIRLSLMDFDNALTKAMRSIKVDWTGGGSVDISYQLDSLAGSYTSLQVGAVSGTEYTLPAGTQGNSISVQVTLNNSAGNVPTLKRVYVRAVPILQSYRMNTYILDCSGNKNAPQPSYVKLGDNVREHNLDGEEQVVNLRAAIAAGVVSVTDRFGTFNGIIEPAATSFKEVRQDYGRGEYRVELAVRET